MVTRILSVRVTICILIELCQLFAVVVSKNYDYKSCCCLLFYFNK